VLLKRPLEIRDTFNQGLGSLKIEVSMIKYVHMEQFLEQMVSTIIGGLIRYSRILL
jgi:hypothetical protein